MATHSSTLAWRILMDRGGWWTAVHGDAKSWTRLSAALGISLWASRYLSWESCCFISCILYAPLDSHKILVLKLRPSFSEQIRLQENAKTTLCWPGAGVCACVYLKGRTAFPWRANVTFRDNNIKTLCPRADSHGCMPHPKALFGTPYNLAHGLWHPVKHRASP